MNLRIVFKVLGIFALTWVLYCCCSSWKEVLEHLKEPYVSGKVMLGRHLKYMIATGVLFIAWGVLIDEIVRDLTNTKK